LGVIFTWAAVFSGDRAEEIVNRVLCDPTVTHDHGDWAYKTSYFFTAILILDLLAWRDLIPLSFISVTRYGIVIALVISLAILVRTAHLGASLVYQQGAGVYHPTAQCKEFE
jgi:hypothetical protein